MKSVMSAIKNGDYAAYRESVRATLEQRVTSYEVHNAVNQSVDDVASAIFYTVRRPV